MDTIKWLKRKYPNNYKRIMSEFDTKHIKDYMKGYGHIPAILKEDIENYKKGTYF